MADLGFMKAVADKKGKKITLTSYPLYFDVDKCCWLCDIRA